MANFIPSPRRGRVREGVKMWQAAIAAYQRANPHPNLPPVRGKELELLLNPLPRWGNKLGLLLNPLPLKGEG